MEEKYVIIRAYAAGCFAGILVEHDRATRTAVLRDARRLWFWEGAASLSQLATTGTSKPKGCKFPPPTVGNHIIAQVEEVIPVTAEARESIETVPVWKQ